METEDRTEDDITAVEVAVIAVATTAAVYGAFCIVRKATDIATDVYDRHRVLKLMKKASK